MQLNVANMIDNGNSVPTCQSTLLMRRVVFSEWPVWAGGAIIALFVASVLSSGLTKGLIPELTTPYKYDGDVLFHSWMIQRVIEGWLFENPRNGYPFGSNFLDYPGSDFVSHFLMKLLGSVGGNFQFALNLYFLLGFAVTFAFAYLALRYLGISTALACAGAFIFDFLPFHFLRLTHLFYTWYFVVPVFFVLGLVCFESAKNHTTHRPAFWKFALLGVGLVVVASFGVYYALFGVTVLVVAGVSGAIAQRSYRPLRRAVVFAAMVTAGVLLNVLPSAVYRVASDTNLEVAKRSPGEAEIYGLKMMQLLIPRQGHRNEYLANQSKAYNQGTPLVNENSISALGMIGATGFLAMFVVLLVRISGVKVDDRLALIALIVLVLFLFGTVGGLGSLFAFAISPMIRGWNRISVFIGFGAIAGLLLLLQAVVKRYLSPPKSKVVFVSAASALVMLAFYDQTTSACLPCNEQTQKEFEHDRAFVQAIERQLPNGAAVYQLPYMSFPEVPPLYHLSDYALGVGFLHSRALRWSYAGMKGRPGDLFYRGLAQEPIQRQIKVIRKLGFSGVYVDRRGYADNGAEIVSQLTAALGHGPTLEHIDGKMAFFSVEGADQVRFDGLEPTEIMRRVGYFADRLGKRYLARLEDGIDFTRKEWPAFLRDISGISGWEPWGRWSDSGVDSKVRLDFTERLPKKFLLEMNLRVFGPNAGERLKIKIGEKSYEAALPKSEGMIRVQIENSEGASYIELYPPKPSSPALMGLSSDARKLGIGLVSLFVKDEV